MQTVLNLSEGILGIAKEHSQWPEDDCPNMLAKSQGNTRASTRNPTSDVYQDQELVEIENDKDIDVQATHAY